MFQSARIKLTAWYILIIMIVCLFFSGIVFRMLTQEVDRFDKVHQLRLQQFQNNPPLQRGEKFLVRMPLAAPELVAETKHRILMLLVGINAGIFILAGGLSYFLAGVTLQPIKEMMDEQNRFVSDASHELKTPLTSLKSAFEVYLREKKPTLAESRTLVQESIGEVNTLQSLAESLLQLAQYQHENGHIKMERLSLNTVISEAVSKVGFKAKQKNIHIVENLESSKVFGNKYGLVDLFIILLDNAIKYSSAKTTITIDSDIKKDGIEIKVQDEGPGISKKDLPHIFDRFYRSDTARSKKSADGYGLGLSIANKIVEVHKGTIHAKSEYNEGTLIIVELPL